MKEKKSVFERLEAEVISETEDYIKEKVTKKVIKIGEVSVAFLVGFILVIVGIINLIGHFYPNLSYGYNYLLVGGLFLLIGVLLKI